MSLLQDENKQHKRMLLILLLFALFAGAAIGLTTRWGPWAYSDGVGYIANARNLSAGHGLGLFRASGRFVVTSHQPPLYILVLAGPSLFGIDPLPTARYLGISSFSVLVFLVGYFSFRLTRNSLLAIAVSAVMLTSPYLIDLYAGAMSEGLFILLSTTAILFYAYGVNRERDNLIYLAAALLGLASITRYAGIGFLIALTLTPLFLKGKTFRHKLFVTGISLFIAIIPLAMWNLWLGSQASAEPVRSYSFELGRLVTYWRSVRAAMIDSIWESFPFLSKYLLDSYQIRFFILAGLAIIFASMILLGYRRNKVKGDEVEAGFWLTIIPLAFVFSYSLTLIAAFIFSNPQPDFDLRTLSPAMGLVYISLVSCCFWVISFINHRSLKLLYITPLILLTIGNVLQSRWLIDEYHTHGRGYTSQGWQDSMLLEQLGEYAWEIPIITNDSIAILLYHDRYAYDLIPAILREEDVELVRFGDQGGEELNDIFREKGALLVVFNTFQFQLAERIGGKWQEVQTTLLGGLEVDYEAPDGAIYLYPTTSE